MNLIGWGLLLYLIVAVFALTAAAAAAEDRWGKPGLVAAYLLGVALFVAGACVLGELVGAAAPTGLFL